MLKEQTAIELKDRMLDILGLAKIDDDENGFLLSLFYESAKALDELVGVELDFDDKGLQELLMSRVRYSYNNAVEYFEDNFKSQILRLQLMKGCEEYAKQATSS